MNKPTIQSSHRKAATGELVVIPFFIDSIPVDTDLYKFVFPKAMTLVRAVIKIDKLLRGPLVLIGEVKSEYKFVTVTKLVNVGVNTIEFDIAGDIGDIFVLRFEDRNLAKEDISGIVISLVMKS